MGYRVDAQTKESEYVKAVNRYVIIVYVYHQRRANIVSNVSAKC